MLLSYKCLHEQGTWLWSPSYLVFRAASLLRSCTYNLGSSEFMLDSFVRQKPMISSVEIKL